MKFNDIKTNTFGYSLIEIMVSMAIFAILLLSVLSIAQAVSKGQKSAIVAQNAQESLRFALEVMSKEIRSAKQSDDDCNPSASPNSDNNEIFNVYNGGAIGNGDVLYFKNKNDECVYYFLENDGGVSRLKIARDDDIFDGSIDNQFFITPNDVNITNLKFLVHDNQQNNLFNMPIQALVELKMDVEGKNVNFKQKFSVQTSVSSRHY